MGGGRADADRVAQKDRGFPGNPDGFFTCPTQPALGRPVLPQVRFVNISLLAGSRQEGRLRSGGGEMLWTGLLLRGRQLGAKAAQESLWVSSRVPFSLL